MDLSSHKKKSAFFFIIVLMGIFFCKNIAWAVTLHISLEYQGNASGFKIYYSLTPEGYLTFHGNTPGDKVFILSSPTSTDGPYTVSLPLTSGETYYVAITAFDNQANESAFSAESSLYIPTSPETGTDGDVDGKDLAELILQISQTTAPFNPADFAASFGK